MAYGESRTISEKHKFVCETTRFGFSGFQKCSELKVDAAKIEYFEGGALIPIKDAGRLTFSDVTLERGTSSDFNFYSWILDVGNAARGPGGAGVLAPKFKDDIAIIQRDRDNSKMREWSCIGAFPLSYTAGDWDNTVDEVVIEMLTLTYDWFEAI